MTTTTPPAPAPSAEAPSRPPAPRRRATWSLQARLMTAIIGMVALILAIIGLSTSVILSQVLQDNLDSSIREAAQQIRPAFAATATQALQESRQPPGTVFVISNGTSTTGAYVDDDYSVRDLDEEQVSDMLTALSSATSSTVDLPGLGTYRVGILNQPGVFVMLGMPLSEVSGIIAQILTTIALVTTGGLLLLGSIIALVIRVGLRPLRAVADTATRVATLRLDSGDVTIAERVPADQADAGTEIGQVGSALNALLDHVDASLAARQRNEDLMRRFVADASHELRTPLASIRGYSELSLRDRTLSETSEEALQRIQAQSLRMTALVEDLLLLARLDEGQELVYGSVDLTRLALEAVADVRPTGADHRWGVDVDDDPVLLAGDASRLHQVVVNLLANARTHTPAGTEVTVSVRREGADAVLRVHDDGPGVDPAVTDQLFERFARADRSRDRKTGGTGLGLSIARAIVDAHGGRLSVRSIPGDTTFEVRLPARPADPA